jgi:acetyl/propionyl-CoA carboxylase alpha subunit/acetyl-CoA carboxylase carboxyltransferase component
LAQLERIAILNRGEAATRCVRAIRELRLEQGLPLVAIALYTDPDRFAAFVRDADEALSLGPALRRTHEGGVRSAYLDHERVLAALRAAHADAVWPGWGFLAEDPAFVERLEASGIAFLGPRAQTMRALGDKITSKRIAEAAGVPIAPWSGGPVAREELARWAGRIGYPLVLKATAGGGGRGIRVVREPGALEAAFDSATAEAAAAFGDGTLFLEAYVGKARHVEAQMAADKHGGVLALGLRDCSMQRRHQKIVEEGPPPALPESLCRELREASVRLLRRAGYEGVATCEYLVTPDHQLCFLEVNPRLQVEHGVTELLTGFDLVKAQIRIALGEKLPDQAPPERGHAIEARLCAEDPSAGFVPSPGRIALLELPAGPGIRVDSGLSLHDAIPAEFDSMIAKVIAWGAHREEARARLLRALADLRIVLEGGMTNKGFLLDAVAHPDFRDMLLDTGWLDRASLPLAPAPTVEVLVVAAILSYQRERAGVRLNFYAQAARGRPQQIPSSSGAAIDLVYAGASHRLDVYAVGDWTYRVFLGDRSVQASLLEQGPFARQLTMNGSRRAVLFGESDVELRIELDGRLHRVLRDVGGKVRAPAPALVIELSVGPGDAVVVGDRLGLLEAMKTETAFFAPVAGVVREVLVQQGERVAAGDVMLVIEPAPQEGEAARDGDGAALELPVEIDPLQALVDPATGSPSLDRVGALPVAARTAAAAALRGEVRRILLGYDVNDERADLLVAILESPLTEPNEAARAELAALSREVATFTDVESLFSRAPTRDDDDELGPSNDARMTMYLRRMQAEGAGIAPSFLEELRRALRHYSIDSLTPGDALQRAILRCYATRTTGDLRARLMIALIGVLIRLAEHGETFERDPGLRDALERLALLRGVVPPTVADMAAQARFHLFEKRVEDEDVEGPALRVDPDETIVPPPDPDRLARRAAELELDYDEARRIELWRLDEFDLERVDAFPGTYCFYGHARRQPGDERIVCFAEVTDLGPGAPSFPDLGAFERRFHEGIEALRAVQAARDPSRRLHWNRLYLLVRPRVVLTPGLLGDALRRLSPETAHLGLERVVVRLAHVGAGALDAPPEKIEVIAGNPTGSRVEWSMRTPHREPLSPATPYERRVAAARARGLVYPYEIVRLFTAAPAAEARLPGDAIGPGSFVEYELVDGRAVPVQRPWGGNEAGVVIGVIKTPTRKFPEGMSRVLILGDSTRGMGALAAPECDRICAAIDMAERERIPVEWVAVSSGARIALDSGTENLDATARVVRRLVTFTDGGGEVNLILPGVNVGAQSYFDALATMGLQTRGVLIMLPPASMVLTGRAALEVAGGVSAEDEVGIGGYERVMGPSGQAQYQARDLADAHATLLEHYATSYVAPGERGPRRFATSDARERDVTRSPCEGDPDFTTIGEIFSAEHNAERKRPFSMRPLMRAVIDQDAGWLERWRDWSRAETAIVWDAHLGGWPITLVGIESRPIARIGYVPNDGPESWTAGTLFPHSSKKVARAINAASGVRPALILANLSGFDGSPESMRLGILEYGAEIARAVVRFRGPLLFVVVSRYHGGAYVVFSRELNDSMRVGALSGSYASVIGGAAAAAVVFPREVRQRANADPRVRRARERVSSAPDAASRTAARANLERVLAAAILEHQAAVADEFDAIHTVERAREVGSLEAIIEPAALRPRLIAWLEQG